MKRIDKIRRIAVVVSMIIGIVIGVYEKMTELPQYEGVGSGFMGDVKISITLDGKRIEAINVVDHSETVGISDPAFIELIPVIIEKQHLNIDNIIGATYTSIAIKEAVKEAASKGGLELQIEEITDEEMIKNKLVEAGPKDLIKTIGSGEGYLEDIVVEVSKSEGKIVDIEVIFHEDTRSIADPALKELKNSVIKYQHTNIDMVAGATWTSEGFLEAVENALEGDK